MTGKAATGWPDTTYHDIATTCVYIYMYMHIYIYIYICMYRLVRNDMHMYIHIYIFVNTYGTFCVLCLIYLDICGHIQ